MRCCGAAIQALGDEAADVLATASVLGSEFQEDLLIEMVDIPEAQARRAIDSAVTAGVLLNLPSVRRILRFAHVLIANALYAEIGASTRAQLHEQAVRVLSKRAGESSPDLAVQLARHSALAGMGPEAIHWSTVAGDDALMHLSPTEAARHYRSAFEAALELGRPVAEQADLLVRLGEAQHVAGDSSALSTLAQAANLAFNSGNNQALVAGRPGVGPRLHADRRRGTRVPGDRGGGRRGRRSVRHVDLCTLARPTLAKPRLHATSGPPNRHCASGAGPGRVRVGPCSTRPRGTGSRLGDLDAGERTDAQRRRRPGAHLGGSIRGPKARVRRAYGRLQRGRRVGGRGRGCP